MNKKLSTAISFVFLSIGSLCMITDVLFPYFMYLIKAFIVIASLAMLYTAAVNLKRYFKALNRKKKETVYNLIFKSGIKSSIVNLLTVYRIIMAPVLLILLFKEIPSFKWILLSAFLTDALDGFLARHWKVTTKLGARMDSLADDILFSVSLIAMLYYYSGFLYMHLSMIGIMLFIFSIKILILWCKHYKFISGMHTYCNKYAAFLQAIFFLHCIFIVPNNLIFNIAAITTIIAITEEIIIILSFKELKQNVKGLFFIKSQM